MLLVKILIFNVLSVNLSIHSLWTTIGSEECSSKTGTFCKGQKINLVRDSQFIFFTFRHDW